MFVDLDRTLTFKIKVAQIFGIDAAVYWAALTEVAKRVVDKNTFDEDGYFLLNREYIMSITTLTLEQQYECDQQLAKLSVLAVNEDNKDKLCLRFKEMTELLVANGEEIKAAEIIAKKATKGGKAAAKKNAQVENMTKWLSAGVTNAELIDAMIRWAEAVSAKYGWQTKANTLAFRETIFKNCPKVEDQIKAFSYAASCAYRVADWVVNFMNRNGQQSVTNISINDQVY